MSITAKKINVINEYVGPPYGNIYATAVDLYPSFRALREAPMHFNQEDVFAGGRNEDGELSIHLGMRPQGIVPRMRARLIERFRLPKEIESLPDNYLVLRPFIFAHELGHVVQADPEFSKYFGRANLEVLDATTDYPRYVRSDNEVNADYIAATVIANSELGVVIEYGMPVEGPMAWRQWGESHPVEQTIAKFAIDPVAI